MSSELFHSFHHRQGFCVASQPVIICDLRGEPVIPSIAMRTSRDGRPSHSAGLTTGLHVEVS